MSQAYQDALANADVIRHQVAKMRPAIIKPAAVKKTVEQGQIHTKTMKTPIVDRWDISGEAQ